MQVLQTADRARHLRRQKQGKLTNLRQRKCRSSHSRRSNYIQL